jgi:hypothetical protein
VTLLNALVTAVGKAPLAVVLSVMVKLDRSVTDVGMVVVPLMVTGASPLP